MASFYSAHVNRVRDNGLPLATALAFWYPKTSKVLTSGGARIDNIVFASAAGKTASNRKMDFPSVIHSPSRFPDPFDKPISIAEEINLAFIKASLCDQFRS
ncbi:MAG: hypothetical protein OEQ53_16345, partial [Saprospiraceae bacterium]|nr:hypothetical protein [Saprospiraceae bacterium]